MGSYMRHVFLGDPMFFDTLLLTDVELPRSASWTLASTTPPSEKKKIVITSSGAKIKSLG